MVKKLSKNRIPLLALLMVIALIIVLTLLNRSKNIVSILNLTKPNTESFEAPGREWPSEKKVEDYFISNLHMSPEEASQIRSKPEVDGKVMLRLGDNSTIDALISNLKYYGFVRDEIALRYALEHSADNNPGKTYALKVGENTVDTFAYYRISENMSAWEIANELLNNPTHFAYDEYHYMFMP